MHMSHYELLKASDPTRDIGESNVLRSSFFGESRTRSRCPSVGRAKRAKGGGELGRRRRRERRKNRYWPLAEEGEGEERDEEELWRRKRRRRKGLLCLFLLLLLVSRFLSRLLFTILLKGGRRRRKMLLFPLRDFCLTSKFRKFLSSYFSFSLNEGEEAKKKRTFP